MLILALDIGGTVIKSALVDPDNHRCLRQDRPSEGKRGGAVLMRNALDLAASYQDYDRIAISVTGQVNPKDGSIIFANDNVPGFTGTGVRDLFARQFQVPVAVMNDVNAAALGEAYYGAATDQQDFLCLTYGTGIGGAIVINRQVYTGSRGSAGEFGHILTHPGGLACTCGQRGCYEQYASTTALLRSAAARSTDYQDSRRLFTLMGHGDPDARQLIETWIDEINLGLISLIHIFNPSCLVLGGGIMEQPRLIEVINQRLFPLLMPSFRLLTVRAASLGNEAGLMGAAVAARLLDD
jgi:glucokinase